MSGLVDFLTTLLEMCFGSAFGISEGATVTFTGNQAIYAPLWNIAGLISDNVIEPIAICIVVLYFLLSIIEKLSSENFNLEHIIKEFVKLFMGLYLVTNSLNLVIDLIELGNGIITRVTSIFTGNIPTASEITFALDGVLEGNVLLGYISVVPIFLVIIILLILFALMKGICLIRLIDIAIRAAMSPIALSDTFAGSFLNSHAMNFIRSFAAVCLQGVFITIIANFVPVAIGGVLSSETYNTLGQLLGALFKTLPVTIACFIIMLKSGSIAKELLGAR